MNRIRLTALAVCVLCAFQLTFVSETESAEAKTIGPKDLILSIDIDGTMFDTIFDRRQIQEPSNLASIVAASDGEHLAVYGAAPFLQTVLDRKFKDPDRKLRIAFFSGGDSTRNQELLKHLKFKDGKNALDVAYQVLSKEDLTPSSNGSKKDLRKVDSELSRIVHLDDNPNYVLPGQEKNVLSIAPAYMYVDNFSKYQQDRANGLKLKAPPPDRLRWAWDTQRLIYARGVLEEALDLMERRPDLSFQDAVSQLQQTHDPRRFFSVGQRVLSRYALDHSPEVKELDCPRVVTQFLQRLAPL